MSNPGAREMLALLDALKNAIRDFAAREEKLNGDLRAQSAAAARLSDEAAVKRAEKLAGGVDAENAAFEARKIPARAGPRRVLNRHDFRRRRKRLQAVPDRSCRSAPPVTMRNGFWKLNFAAISSGIFRLPFRTTKIISPTHSASSKRCQVCATTGRPATLEIINPRPRPGRCLCRRRRESRCSFVKV